MGKLTAAQVSLLGHVINATDFKMVVRADRYRTGTVNALVKRGLIQRVKYAPQGKLCFLEPTEQGRAALDAAKEAGNGS